MSQNLTSDKTTNRWNTFVCKITKEANEIYHKLGGREEIKSFIERETGVCYFLVGEERMPIYLFADGRETITGKFRLAIVNQSAKFYSKKRKFQQKRQKGLGLGRFPREAIPKVIATVIWLYLILRNNLTKIQQLFWTLGGFPLHYRITYDSHTGITHCFFSGQTTLHFTFRRRKLTIEIKLVQSQPEVTFEFLLPKQSAEVRKTVEKLILSASIDNI